MNIKNALHVSGPYQHVKGHPLAYEATLARARRAARRLNDKGQLRALRRWHRVLDAVTG